MAVRIASKKNLPQHLHIAVKVVATVHIGKSSAWTTEELGFDFQQEQEILRFSTPPRPALGAYARMQ
jgi:hypothetical protein